MEETEEFEILKYGFKEPHDCPLPGFWRRRKYKLKLGARIKCKCGCVWQYRDIGWMESDRCWNRSEWCETCDTAKKDWRER